ncbi:hypothetical protein DWX11_09330 [Ruminococcus sp. AF18-29]|jgi:hypothetical protein|nr:hypothetical protein DWX11_09330 [Ruminococcus sp. AF18-29]
MITKEEFKKAVEYCATDPTDCEGCPLCASDKHRMCSTYLAEYIKNESKPVIKNIPSAESNTNAICENAKITDVSLGIGDHCCLTFSIVFKGLGWGVSFGGYNLAFFNGTSFEGSEKGLEALIRIMDVVGVAKWEDIKGHYVRVKQENRLVVGIGNIIEDKWFEPREFFKGD